MNITKDRSNHESGNESNSEDEICLPMKSKAIIDESSSSESDIETYLQKPEDINLNTTFFKVDKTPFKAKEKFECNSKTTLSDSDSDDPLSVYVPETNESLPSSSKACQEQKKEDKEKIYIHDAFKDINKQMHELEEYKKLLEAYESRKKSESGNKNNEIDDLLASGEKFDLAKDLAMIDFHPSDFESENESEKGDWEEVQESPEKGIIPKHGVQISVDMPSVLKKKKGVDLVAALKRRMNKFRKESQVYIHKVHLLCWIAHGNYVNNILNKENILALAVSLLPAKACYPPDRASLKYLEQICTWFNKAMKCKFTSDEETSSNLEEQIQEEISDKVVTKPNILVYIFIAMLRALGLQCRLVLSLQVEPLRPPAHELFSLANENKALAKTSGENDKKPKDCGKNAGHTSENNKTTKSAHIQKPAADKTKLSSYEEISGNKRSKSSTGDCKNSSKFPKQLKLDAAEKLTKTKKSPTALPTKSNASGENINANNFDNKSPPNPKSTKSVSSSEKTTELIHSEKVSTGKPNLRRLKNNSSTENKEPAQLRPTRSRAKKSLEGCLKLPNDITKAHNATSEIKSSRSKSASHINITHNELPLPRSKLEVPKNKQSKSDSSKSKAKLIANIDKKILELESLEKTKPNLSKLKSVSSTDDDIDDVAAWRRSKSPRVSEPPKTVADNIELEEKATPTCSKSIPNKTSYVPNPALLDSMFQSDEERKISKVSNNIKIRIPPKRRLDKVPQVDGQDDSLDSFSLSEDDNSVSIAQVDGADDKRTKPKLKALTPPVSNCNQKHSLRLKIKQPSTVLPTQTPSTATNKTPNINKLKSPPSFNDSPTKSSPSKSFNVSRSKFFTPEKPDVKDVVVNLLKADIRENKLRVSKLSPRSYKEESDSSDFLHPKKKSPRSYKDESDSSDFVPLKKKKSLGQTTKVKKRVLPRSKIAELAKEKAETEKQKTKGIDVWVEVYLDEEEKWICADVTSGKVHCIKDVYNKASHPMSYVLTWDNTNRIKDVTKRYSPNWNTVTRKLRVEPEWWETSLKSYVGKKTARDREEDEDLARLQLDQPLPKTISEYKDHPLYVLKRHLLKFQALYPPEPAILGMVRNEPVYSRDCVYILHSRDIWLKHAKVVKLGEKPYKIVKARPKYDKLSNSMITDQLLEIFGMWQVEDYDPPTAENGVVPRNAYGNVELFKTCMLPKKCAHLQLPGLNKIARKLQIDCAPAVTGFDFHGGWNHAVYDGFIVCEEFKDTLIAAWEQEQEEIVKREKEKYEKRVFGNWRRLIKAALIRERLKRRYDFTNKKPVEDIDDFPEVPEERPVQEERPPKKKRPKFMSRK